MKYLMVLIFCLSTAAIAQQQAPPITVTQPAAPVVVGAPPVQAPVGQVIQAPVQSTSVFSWFAANWSIIASVLLGISEALGLVFPSSSGFGGILAGIIKFLSGVGIKPPTTPAA